jgi:RecA-family ATPase
LRAPRGLRPAKANGIDNSGDPLPLRYVDRWIGRGSVATPILVAGLIPDWCASIVAGAGGAGKGILMQTAATCIASVDKPFLGRATEHGRAVFITAEDPEHIVHARQERICKALDISIEDLAGTLIVEGMADRDMFLFSDRKPTALAVELEQRIEALGSIRLLVLDSAALVYDDSEIDRRLVSAFLRYLNRLAMRLKCAIVLITHPSRSSDDTAERMTSGSTAWVNQARAALLLKAEDGGASLALLKANYMKAGLKVDLVWTNDGVLLAKDAPGMVERISDGNDDKLVLDQITARWQHPDAEPLTKAPNMKDRYLPRYMARNFGWSARRGEQALIRLVDAVRITSGDTKKHGKKLSGLRPVSDEKNQG